MKCVGFKKIAGTYNGYNYDKTVIYFTEPMDEQTGIGLKAGKYSVPNEEASKITVGDQFNVSFNKYGKAIKVFKD